MRSKNSSQGAFSAVHHAIVAGSSVSFALPDGTRLLDNISFSLARQHVGLVGPNGIGKTTLLRLIAGELQPLSGSINRRGRFGVLPQRLTPRPNQTLGELFGVADDTDGQASERATRLLHGLGLSSLHLDRQLQTLSGGELIRAHIAGLLAEPLDGLLLDEPTNDLDRGSRQALYRFLEACSGTVLVISHDRRLLQGLEAIWELTSLGLRIYGGGYEFYETQRGLEQSAAERQAQNASAKLKRETRDLRRSIERQRKRMARGRKAADKANLPAAVKHGNKGRAEMTLARSTSTHEFRLARAKLSLEAARTSVRPENRIIIDLPATCLPSGKIAFALDDVNVEFTDSPLWRSGISLAAVGPERIAIVGPNGSGKTTLLSLICQRRPVAARNILGTARLGVATFGYLDQRVAILDDSRSLLQNLEARAPRSTVSDLRARLGRFLFVGDSQHKKAADLAAASACAQALLASSRPMHPRRCSRSTNRPIISILIAWNNWRARC